MEINPWREKVTNNRMKEKAELPDALQTGSGLGTADRKWAGQCRQEVGWARSKSYR